MGQQLSVIRWKRQSCEVWDGGESVDKNCPWKLLTIAAGSTWKCSYSDASPWSLKLIQPVYSKICLWVVLMLYQYLFFISILINVFLSGDHHVRGNFAEVFVDDSQRLCDIYFTWQCSFNIWSKSVIWLNNSACWHTQTDAFMIIKWLQIQLKSEVLFHCLRVGLKITCVVRLLVKRWGRLVSKQELNSPRGLSWPGN